jgi:mono/diheme cytochrome c family protein
VRQVLTHHPALPRKGGGILCAMSATHSLPLDGGESGWGWLAAVGTAVLLLLAACGGREMKDQEKYEPYEAAALFADGSAMQHPVPGTVARDEPALRAELRQRPPMSTALLERGRERFDIYCSPCHSGIGDGEGIVVQRGFPQPPSYHTERLREAPASHFVAVITEGYGVMYSYAARVPPADRWAIAAYIQALQLSQHAELSELPEADRRKLEELAR